MLKHEELKFFDDELRDQYGDNIVGIDDCGNGAWGGPMVACACMLPPDLEIKDLNDSKKLSPKKRKELSIFIKENCIEYQIEYVSALELDENGFVWANRTVMQRAAEGVTKNVKKVDLYIIDQSPAFMLNPHKMLPKADGLSLSVAAASVIAKVHRDNYMIELSKQYPEYHFDSTKGYINTVHIDAVKKHGLIKGVHRHSYNVKGIN